MSKKQVPTLQPVELTGFRLNLDYFLGSDYSDVSIASEELPPVIEWVNEKLQEIVEQRIIKGQEIKTIEARAYFDLRREGAFAERGLSGKQTEEAVKRAVDLEPKVIEATEELAVLEGWYKRLQGMQGSLSAKLELVRSSEATRRKVFDSNDRD